MMLSADYNFFRIFLWRLSNGIFLKAKCKFCTLLFLWEHHPKRYLMR